MQGLSKNDFDFGISLFDQIVDRSNAKNHFKVNILTTAN
jgi:hypothetical protein